MSSEKKILDFDKKALFISSRLCQFVLDNALKINLSDEMLRSCLKFSEDNQLYKQGNSIHKLEVFSELIDICRKANTTNEQFYEIGNTSHDCHVLVSSIVFNKIENLIDWRKELNLIRMTVCLDQGKMKLDIELHQRIIIEYKKILPALLHLLRGFIDRINTNLFNSQAKLIEKKAIFTLSHTMTNASNFDLVRHISHEEFVYSRLSNFVSKKNEESISETISFFLFKDIGFSIEEIAAKLNLSVRSLQRKLKEEDYTFRALKEAARKELSLKYLRDKSNTINDIGFLLGYSERGAFEKAFKKWYGKNPSEYKRKLG